MLLGCPRVDEGLCRSTRTAAVAARGWRQLTTASAGERGLIQQPILADVAEATAVAARAARVRDQLEAQQLDRILGLDDLDWRQAPVGHMGLAGGHAVLGRAGPNRAGRQLVLDLRVAAPALGIR